MRAALAYSQSIVSCSIGEVSKCVDEYDRLKTGFN